VSDSALIISPMIAAIIAGVLALVADAAARPRVAVGVAIVGLAAGCVLAAVASQSVEGGSLAYGVFIGGGELSAVGVPIFALAALSLLGGMRYLSNRETGAAMAALVAFATAASSALAASADLILTAIALETIAICAYALVSAARTDRSAEAALKYLIQGAVSTGLLILGMALLFGLYGGSRSYPALGLSLPLGPAAPAGAAAALILSAFAFKLGAVPFHAWAPDVFETAPSPAAAFMAGAPKIAALFGLFVVFAQVFEASVENLAYQVAALAALSIVLGNFAGLRQRSYSRMLGYSGIAQVGYALAGLAVGLARGEGGVANMLRLTLVLIVMYAIAATAAFLIAQAVSEVRPDWDGSIAGMAGIGRQRPALGLALGVTMFSLTGIPLTAGFWGKLLVFGVLSVTSGWLWLALVAVVGSVISFGYYGSVLRAAFFDEPPLNGSVPHPDPPAEEPADAVAALPRLFLSEGTALFLAVVLLGIGIVPLFSGLDSILALFAG